MRLHGQKQGQKKKIQSTLARHQRIERNNAQVN